MGHLLTDKGVKIDPEKLNPVKSMKKTKNVQELRVHRAKFLPMSDKSASLRELLLKDNEWHWEREQERGDTCSTIGEL